MRLAEINLRPHVLDIQRYIIENYSVEDTASSGSPLVDTELSVISDRVGVIMKVDLPYFKDQVFIYPAFNEGRVYYHVSETDDTTNAIGEVKNTFKEAVELAVNTMANEKTIAGDSFIERFYKAYRLPKHSLSAAELTKIFIGLIKGRELVMSKRKAPDDCELVTDLMSDDGSIKLAISLRK